MFASDKQVEQLQEYMTIDLLMDAARKRELMYNKPIIQLLNMLTKDMSLNNVTQANLNY